MPRALIHSIQATGIRLTEEVLQNITGCSEYCFYCIRKQPVIHVPAEMNRTVRNQFMQYIKNYFEFQRYAAIHDRSAVADLGNYMDGYEE